MSVPSLGSERNLAHHGKENPFDASDRFFGAPPGKVERRECRPLNRVTTVTSDASGPHLRTLCKLLRALRGLMPPPPAAEMGD
jgi:hypothetical protein